MGANEHPGMWKLSCSQETFTDFGGFNIQNVRVFIITDTINIIICSSWEKHGLNSLQA